MEWRALEEHFREALRLDPGPFGDDAIEWDHSRYARALGLTGEPGAHDLPHRACVVASLPPARWDAAQKRISAMAEQRGWALWRISARPSVVVPDPVTYALGVRAAGPDSIPLARAARPVARAAGRRSEEMPFPLTTGERWLIATDRVRRRMRAEIGMRGIVLFIEEAEWLTPAGLGVLMYLLDAQRAARARMLSRPARVYVVLATAPEHEGSVVRMLGRFRLNGHLPVLRERRKTEAGMGSPPPAPRDAEEEYLLGALAAAPVVLSAEDVRAAFGASAVDRCRAMTERDLLRERVEAGQVCYAVNPAVAPSASPEQRTLAALDMICRKRARRGHEHVRLASAAISISLKRPRRAIATVARMPHTAGALLPLRLFEMLDPALAQARPRLRADHVAAWFSLSAHQRVYDQARDLANALTERELRNWKELYRVVRLILCTGRTMLDTCLPADIWPRLRSERIAGSFMDATCVLAELFWRKRYLDNTEIRQRFEFARDCFERDGSDRPRSKWFDRLEQFSRLVIYRAALHLDTPTRILCSAESPQATLRTFLRTHPMPAYLIASTVFAESAAGEICMRRSLDGRDRYFAMSLDATTGHPGDVMITTATDGGRLSRRGLRLLLRNVFDDLLLTMYYRANAADWHEGGRFLMYVVGGRGWLVGTNAVFLRHGRQDIPGRDAFDELGVAAALMAAGDLAGARDQLMAGLAWPPRCPLLLASQLEACAIIARKSLDSPFLGSVPMLIEKHRRTLGPDLCRYLEAFVRGSEALLAADFEVAQQSFLVAYDALLGNAERAVELKKRAMAASVRAGYVRRVVTSWPATRRRRAALSRVVRALCVGPDWLNASPLLGERAAVCMDFLCGVLDAWASVEHDDENVLHIALLLKEPVDATFRPLGRDFVQLMATWAPRFYERLRAAAIAMVGDLGIAAPESRALGASIRTIEEGWKNGLGSLAQERCSRVRICADRSRARQAKLAAQAWHDDATTYAQLWEADGRIRACPGGQRVVVAYGHVGRSRSRPIATALKFVMSPVEGNGFDVDVETQPSVLPSMVGGRRRPPKRPTSELAFVGRSDAAGKVRELVDTAARCSYPVLVIGETGVGKDLVARCIHMASGIDKPLVTAECAGVVESLLESELFGHEKGAFTGAHGAHQGMFERADGSSLLLDEADSMPKRMQAAVLRVLESGEYRRVGGSASRKSEFRLITAALPRLLGMVECGEFRQDLFYRISTLRIEIPPLREREGDSEDIAEAHARSLGFRLTAGARRAIAGYEWPGNVRQLHHCIQAAGLHAVDGRIGEAAMNDVIGTYRGASAAADQERESPEAAWTRALRALEQMKRFGTWDFARATDLSRRSAQRHIARLLREGRIVRIGAGRATQYGLRS